MRLRCPDIKTPSFPSHFKCLEFVTLSLLALELSQFVSLAAADMLTTLLIVALAGVTTAVPKPQGVEIPAAVLTADPVLFTAPLVVASDVPQEVAPAPIEPITDPSSVSKREATLGKRDGTCASQPAGSGPTSTPDTVAAFSANPDIQVSRTLRPPEIPCH